MFRRSTADVVADHGETGGPLPQGAWKWLKRRRRTLLGRAVSIEREDSFACEFFKGRVASERIRADLREQLVEVEGELLVVERLLERGRR